MKPNSIWRDSFSHILPGMPVKVVGGDGWKKHYLGLVGVVKKPRPPSFYDSVLVSFEDIPSVSVPVESGWFFHRDLKPHILEPGDRVVLKYVLPGVNRGTKGVVVVKRKYNKIAVDFGHGFAQDVHVTWLERLEYQDNAIWEESWREKRRKPSRKIMELISRFPEGDLRRYRGKFHLVLDSFLYELSLEWDADEIGSVDELGHYMRLELGQDALWSVEKSAKDQGDHVTRDEAWLVAASYGAILRTDNSGFVNVNYFDSKSSYNKAWRDIEIEYERFYEEQEGQEGNA